VLGQRIHHRGHDRRNQQHILRDLNPDRPLRRGNGLVQAVRKWLGPGVLDGGGNPGGMLDLPLPWPGMSSGLKLETEYLQTNRKTLPPQWKLVLSSWRRRTTSHNEIQTLTDVVAATMALKDHLGPCADLVPILYKTLQTPACEVLPVRSTDRHNEIHDGPFPALSTGHSNSEPVTQQPDTQGIRPDPTDVRPDPKPGVCTLCTAGLASLGNSEKAASYGVMTLLFRGVMTPRRLGCEGPTL
jgi:hypothetical protein